ncbi:MAG: thiamine phosphate synthase [Nitrospinota bacterium]
MNETEKISLDHTLHVITDRNLYGRVPGRGLEDVARAAAQGGATVIQLREKGLDGKELCRMGELLSALSRELSFAFIVNDRLDVALISGAHGVHLGQGDLPIAGARRLTDEALIIGASASNREEALRAQDEGADYLGVGPVYTTGTKETGRAPLGPGGIEAVARAVSIPVVAIGGITAENVAPVIEAGAAGVAVISAVMACQDIERATRILKERIRAARRA